MKFKQFEFNFFPRIRGKKKKKSKYSNSSLDKNFPVDKNFNYSKIHGYDNAVVKRATTAAFDTGNDVYDDGLKYLRSNSDYSAYRDDSCYYSQTCPLPRLTLDIDSCCSCDFCASSVPNSAIVPFYCISSVDTPVGTPLCTRNTIPRTRTRIKTNPWLPSPRTTPSLSPAGTVESLVYSSADFQFRSSQSDHHLSNRELQHASLHSFTQLSQPRDELNNLSKVTEENIDDVSEILEELPRLKARKRFSFTEFLQYDTDDSKCTSPVVEKIEIVGNINCKISFKYEETVDDMLESTDVIPRDSTFLSIKDLLEDDYHITDKSQAYVADDVDEMNGLSEDDHDAEVWSGIVLNKSMDASLSSVSELSDVISNMDLTFYDEGYMLESIDTGYGSGTRDSDDNSETGEPVARKTSEEPSFDEAELEWDNDPSAHVLQGLESNKSRAYSLSEVTDKNGCKNCSARPRSRSLADIEASLDEKVSLLREEKYFVQRKIREAKEEEEVRRKQVQVFRSYSADNRKEVLLQTLNDLKVRLENQSTRLQTSYDTVLSLQRTFSQRESKSPFLETMI